MRQISYSADSAYQYRYFGGFRLLLAVLVMAQHFGADLAPAPLASALAPYASGGVAVLVFFALSGFVFTEAVDSVYRESCRPVFDEPPVADRAAFPASGCTCELAHEFFRLAGGVRLWRSQPSFPDDAFALPNVLLNFLAIVPMGKRFIDYNFLTITWAIRVEMAFYLTMFGCIAIGRRLPWSRGFAVMASALLVLLLPFSWLIVHGHGPEMLGLIPYFAFGGAVYFANSGSRAGWLTVLVRIPVMLWQFIEDQVRIVPIQGIPLSITGNPIILIALLGAMTALALAPIARGRHIDRTLGDLTYPLYLYHEVILVVILTVTTEYAYSTGYALLWIGSAGEPCARFRWRSRTAPCPHNRPEHDRADRSISSSIIHLKET